MAIPRLNDTPRLAAQARWLDRYLPAIRISERGSIVSIGDGIVWIRSLPSAALENVIRFEDGSRALVFQLTRELVGAVLLQQNDRLTSGTAAYLSREGLTVPTGDALLGRVIDPLGNPLDGLPPPETAKRGRIFAPSPPIIDRDFVSAPLYTGTTIIDTMIPIGKGQRQLIIGGSGTGKSSIAVDAVICQRNSGVRCVYVLIGQKRSKVVSIIETLRTAGALSYTTVMVAEAGSLPGLKYLAPFAGCAVAEEWMNRGVDTLVVYDDITLHAQTYRELSLLLRRSPGREAYPGDIFFLHARLLERSTCLAGERSGGSMTALPIIEIQQGELSSYIPTNLISITDGQIYLDQELFAAGLLPAVDVTRSVSRIGGKAQHPRIKGAAGRMKLDYLQFLELELFTRFGSRLEASMEAKIRRGKLLREILRQERLAPLTPEFQVAWLTAFNEGLLDDLQPREISSCLESLARGAAAGKLTLNHDQERWREAVAEWLGVSPKGAGDGET